MHSFSSNRAFTLAELLIVVAIVGILAAMLVPTVEKSRATARQSKSLANIRSVTQATLLFAADNENRLPSLRNSSWSSNFWFEHVEPYLPTPIVGGGWSQRQDFRQSPAYVDPMVRYHHEAADFGASASLFIVSDTSALGLPCVSIPKPSSVAMFMQAEIPTSGQGSWFVDVSAYLSNPDHGGGGTPIPSDHGTGRIIFACGDGSVKTLAPEEFKEKRRELLVPGETQ